MKYFVFMLFIGITGLLYGQGNNRMKLTQLEQAKTVESSKAGQIGLTNSAGDQRYAQYVEIDLTPIGFVPTSTGNTTNYSEFVTDPNGDQWYIDWQGRATQLTGGGSTCDVDWLQISDNSCPDNIADSIYHYKYAAIGARYVFPGAEFLVNDSTSSAIQVIQGSRNARLALYDGFQGTFTMFDHGGTSPVMYMPVNANWIVKTTAGTPQTPVGSQVSHFGVNTQDSTIQFFQYPNTRLDTHTVSNFLYTDALGKVRSGDILDLLDSLGTVVYEYTSAGDDTIPVPPGAKTVQVLLVGAGGGGGSGRKGATSTTRGGGAGGGSGAVTMAIFSFDELSDPTQLIVSRGSGGPGGASISASSTNGIAGTAGGASTLKSISGTIITYAGGGFGGPGGTTSGLSGGGGGVGMFNGTAGGPTGSGSFGPSSGGGGSGSGVLSNNTVSSGGNGTVGYYSLAAGSSGGTPGSNGTASVSTGLEGRWGTGGAGGGGGAITGNAGSGGNGYRGAGGGGGGGATDGSGNSGAGGTGGDGYAIVAFYGGSSNTGSGTVTSVGLSLPAIFSVSGTPVTTAGTLTGSLANQSANTIFAGPTSGGAAAPTFRSLVASDIPSGAGGFLLDGGNTTGTTVTAGTNDNNSLSLETNNVVRATVTAGASTGGAWTVTDVTANTNTATENIVTYQCNSTGPPTTNFGSTMLFQLKSSTTDNRDAAYIRPLWESATDGSRTSALTFGVVNGAAAISECLRLNQNNFTIAGGGTAYSNSALTIGTSYTFGNSGQSLTIGGSTGFITVQSNVASSGGITINNPSTSGSIKIGDNGYSSTSMNKTNLILGDTYTASSGSGTYASLDINPTFNLTGSASGIQRGMNIIPTFTALGGTAKFYSLNLWANHASAVGVYQPGVLSTNYFAGNTGFLDSIPESLVDVAGTIKTQKLVGQDNTPTPTVDASGAGTGASASIVTAQSSDVAGRFFITSGTGAVAGRWLSMAFGSGYSVTPVVILQPEGIDTGPAIETTFSVTVSTTGFEVYLKSLPASPDSKTYEFAYHVIGGK